MFITSGDAGLHTVSFGAGGRAIVAHGGWIGSWELWAAPFTRLSRSWRAIAYDHRGSGATVAPAESITLPAMVDDLFVVMDALGVERCVLAAESAGAAVALEAALARPERFSGLALVGPMYRRPRPEGADPFVQSLQARYEATLDGFARACIPDPQHDAYRRWGRQIIARSDQAAAIQLYECMYGVDLRPRVAEIQVPALVIHGAADRIVPLAEGEWLAANLPQADLLVIPGGGHVPTMTHGDLIADAIDRFFSA